MKITKKSIFAFLLIGILVLLYITTLVTALLSFPGWERLFAASLVASIGMPILLGIWTGLYRILKRKQEETAKENQEYSAEK